MTDQPPTRRDEIRIRYEAIAAYPRFVVGLAFLCGCIMVLDDPSSEVYGDIGRVLIFIGWLVFLLDYLISLLLAANRRQYFAQNVLELVAIIFPPLRMLLLGKVFRSLTTGAKRRFAGRVRIYALYLTTMMMLVGALLVLMFEKQDPQANINSFGDAMWWTAETISTVGYGDFYPVTVGGRLVAILLFVNGIALLSVVTATIAAKVLDYDDTADQDSDVNLSDLNRQLVDLQAQLTHVLQRVPSQEGGGTDDDDVRAGASTGSGSSGLGAGPVDPAGTANPGV